MQTADDSSLRTMYADLRDGKLLEIAAKEQDLTDAARRVLRNELNRRGITDGQIAEFARYLTELEVTERAEPIATRYSGCGTAIFGHEDERADGSYIVTKWFTLFWIPVFHIKEMRIRPVTLRGGSRGYVVLE